MRKEYKDEFADEVVYIPNDFPSYKQINGVDIYDYYAVNRWFYKHFKQLRYIECENCIYYAPEILEQPCQHDLETFDGTKCPHNF